MFKYGLETMKKKVILVIIIVMGFWVFLLNSFGYVRQNSNKIVSPDGSLVVIPKVDTGGGATTAFKTDIMIYKIKKSPSDFLILPKDLFAYKGTPDSIKPEWVDNQTLKITFTDCRSIYGYENTWRNINIIYDSQCPITNP
jgi:hypothetical protein